MCFISACAVYEKTWRKCLKKELIWYRKHVETKQRKEKSCQGSDKQNTLYTAYEQEKLNIYIYIILKFQWSTLLLWIKSLCLNSLNRQ